MDIIISTIHPTDFAALQQGAAVQPRPTAGLLIITDADRSDFLHRMTTNNINALRPGQSAVTVLTSPTARIVFVFTVVCRPDELWLIPAPGEAATLARHLRGQIFFMDKVKVRDASAEYSQSRLIGPQADVLLAKLGFALADAPDNSWQECDGMVAVKQTQFDVPGYALVTTTDQHPHVIEQLVAAGGQLVTDEDAYQTRRIELGRPAPGKELTGDYNPLEAGLAWVCAENKGCYTGQEILARQITYDKVTKTLVGLRSPQPLSVGSTVSVGGQSVGVVTSIADSPTLLSPIALVILKRPHNMAGVQVMVDGVTAEVVTLPFVATQ